MIGIERPILFSAPMVRAILKGRKTQTRRTDEATTLWNTLNAKRGYGWDSNPWVWAVSFKVVQP